MGRTRILLGTKPVLVRIDERLLESLTLLAREAGISRNTLISRILAEYVTSRLVATQPEGRDSQKV